MFTPSHFLHFDANGQKNYKQELTLSYYSILPDPYSHNECSWNQEIQLLPEITWADVYNYLINTASDFTKEKLMANKSLEAYNFFVCGHIQNVFLSAISKE